MVFVIIRHAIYTKKSPSLMFFSTTYQGSVWDLFYFKQPALMAQRPRLGSLLGDVVGNKKPDRIHQ
jgi:hypothetical protein